MPVRGVLFDIGGVLEVNPETGWLDRWAHTLALAPRELERRLDGVWEAGSIGALTLEEIEDQILDALALDHAQLAALMADVWAEYVGTLNQELFDYLGSLRGRYKTGLLSNSFVGAREREQVAYGFESLCEPS